MIQLQEKRDLKAGLESTWRKLNCIRVAFYYLKEHEHVIYEAKEFLEKSEDDQRMTKIINALDDLEDLLDLECFDELEEATEKVLVEIDRGYFAGNLYETFMDEDDEENDEE